MKILQVNIADIKGGACVISWNLHQGYRGKEHHSIVAVKHKFTHDENVWVINNDSRGGRWAAFCNRAATWFDRQPLPGNNKIAAFCRHIAEPGVYFRRRLGIEEFNFPGFGKLIPTDTQIIHCHILHGNFFDLRILPELSQRVPVFITLHDAWLLSGHCAHSFECTRWKTGCSACPDLTIPVPLERDNAAYNWKVKRDIYKRSKLYIATPCQWLMDKVNESILMEAESERKVVFNGVNHDVFLPGDKLKARKKLGLESDAFILLFSANGIKKSRWKDFQLMRRAVEIVGDRGGLGKVIFLALGETAPSEYLGSVEIRFMPYRSQPEEVAEFYRASDLYLHGAKADTFPNAVLEALSCGLPTIATAVGGIPEQVKGFAPFGLPLLNRFDLIEATGILVPAGDSDSFAKAIEFLAKNEVFRDSMSTNAVRDARLRFSMDRQVDFYLDWYQQAIAQYKPSHEK